MRDTWSKDQQWLGLMVGALGTPAVISQSRPGQVECVPPSTLLFDIKRTPNPVVLQMRMEIIQLHAASSFYSRFSVYVPPALSPFREGCWKQWRGVEVGGWSRLCKPCRASVAKHLRLGGSRSVQVLSLPPCNHRSRILFFYYWLPLCLHNSSLTMHLDVTSWVSATSSWHSSPFNVDSASPARFLSSSLAPDQVQLIGAFAEWGRLHNIFWSSVFFSYIWKTSISE